MGNICTIAHCTVFNNTNRVVDIQTFQITDNLCRNPEFTYSLSPGESIVARVGARGKALKIGVIFNQWASGLNDSQPGCKLMIYQVKRGKTLTIERVERNYREETPVPKYEAVCDTTFVECYGQKRVEKHSDYWYKKAAYSWPLVTIS